MQQEGRGEETCSCKLSKRTMTALRGMQDAVSDAQERLNDGDYKAILESTKHVYDACMNDMHKFNTIHDQGREVLSRMGLMAVDGIIGCIIRDEEWKGLTLSLMRQKIEERSHGTIVACGMSDDFLKEVMKKHILQVKKRDRNRDRKRKRAEESTNREDEEHTLFPILRR